MREKTPYVVVALQEAVRMNTLLEEMRRSMEELLLGLDGALNMSDKMEKLAVGIATNSVPALWMAQVSTRYQEVYTLSSWYQVSRLAECHADFTVTTTAWWVGRESMLSAWSPHGGSGGLVDPLEDCVVVSKRRLWPEHAQWVALGEQSQRAQML